MIYSSYCSKHHKLLGDHFEPNRCREVPWGSMNSTASNHLSYLRSATVVDQVHSQFFAFRCVEIARKKRVPTVSSLIRVNKYYPGIH